MLVHLPDDIAERETLQMPVTPLPDNHEKTMADAEEDAVACVLMDVDVAKDQYAQPDASMQFAE